MAKRARKPLSIEEKKIIQDKAGKYTDKEIADFLDRPVRTISSYRRDTLGVEAAAHRTITEDPLSLTEEARKEFFSRHLQNDHFWLHIKDQLTEPEMDFYMSEWSSLCIQFQDIVATERRQIHDLIIAEILDARILKNVKFAREEIDELISDVEVFRETHDLEDDKDAEAYDEKMTDLLVSMKSEAKAIGDQHEKILKQKNEILQHLNGRRKDRIAQIREVKENFIGIVEALKDRKVRNSLARYAEAQKVASNKLEKYWSENEVVFPDGKSDKILKVNKKA